MSDDTPETTETETAPDPDDITPGEGDQQGANLFRDVDDEYDYGEPVDTWLGESAETEVRIENIAGSQVKRFHLVEPETPDGMQAIMDGVVMRDRLAVCQQLVAEPELTEEVWNEHLTGREKTILHDRCLTWIRADEFMSAEMVEEIRSQMNGDDADEADS